MKHKNVSIWMVGVGEGGYLADEFKNKSCVDCQSRARCQFPLRKRV